MLHLFHKHKKLIYKFTYIKHLIGNKVMSESYTSIGTTATCRIKATPIINDN